MSVIHSAPLTSVKLTASATGSVACFLESWLFTAMSGFSVGKRLIRIRVPRTSCARPGFGWTALRTILMFLVIPPLVSDRDLRGLHDRASDTVVIRI